MADERLRDIERQAAQTGAIEDQARLLLERVRVGELDLKKVRLAALCGDATAISALGDTVPDLSSLFEEDGFAYWTGTLALWGKEEVVRAAITAIRTALGAFEEQYPHNTTIRRAVIHIENWLACPCEKHARAVAQASRNAYWAYVNADMPAQAIGAAVSLTANCIAQFRTCQGDDIPTTGVKEATAAVNSVARALDIATVYQVIRENLIAWALKRGDPILDHRTEQPTIPTATV